jgi:hypothetical protein
MISRTGFLYIPAMLLVGIAIVYVLEMQPDWREASFPPLAWPFVVSFLIELTLRPLVLDGRVSPLTMTDRFLGVFGAAFIVTIFLSRQS